VTEASDRANLAEILEALGPYAEGTIIATGQIVTAIINSVGRLAEGLASGGVDAAISGAMIAAGLGTYIYFLNTEPYGRILRFLKLDGLYNVLVNALKILGQGQGSVVSTVATSIHDEAQKCIDKFTAANLPVPSKYFQLRDTAGAVTITQNFESSFIGQIVNLGLPVTFITNQFVNFLTGGQNNLQSLQDQTILAIQQQCAFDFNTEFQAQHPGTPGGPTGSRTGGFAPP
jgi:hypothetical protein